MAYGWFTAKFDKLRHSRYRRSYSQPHSSGVFFKFQRGSASRYPRWYLFLRVGKFGRKKKAYGGWCWENDRHFDKRDENPPKRFSAYWCWGRDSPKVFSEICKKNIKKFGDEGVATCSFQIWTLFIRKIGLEHSSVERMTGILTDEMKKPPK